MPTTPDSRSAKSRPTRNPRAPRKSASRTRATPRSEPSEAQPDSYRERVAVAAYYLAERRGFAPGNELEDWLTAERDLDGSPDAVEG